MIKKSKSEIFHTIGKIKFEGRDLKNPLAFKWYDPEDLFIAHINGMDTFASGLVIADRIIKKSDYLKLRKERHASFDKDNGALYEKGNLTLEDLRELAMKAGEQKKISGRKELYEQLINMYIF